MRVLALLLPAAMTAALATRAETYVVEPGGGGDFATIQDAVDFVSDGDVIELTDGVFTGEGNRDIDFLGKAITVRSQSGNPAVCIVNCQGSASSPHRGFHFHSGEGASSLLLGITILDGHEGFGGGAACYFSSPTIDDVVFSSNSAEDYGGGVACINSSSSLRNCTFIGNTSQVRGGGISCDDSSPQLVGCVFDGNDSLERGGGMRCDGASNPTLTDCTFEDNWAGIHGGAIYLYRLTASGAFPVLTNVTFSGNSCADLGGALVTVWSSPTVTGCIFHDNHANSSGGAIWCGGEDAFPELVNCTMVMNSSSGAGAIYCNAQCAITLDSCIIAFGPAGIPVSCASGSIATLSCCDVYGNTDGD